MHFFAIDDDVGWCRDTETDLITTEADHGDDDIPRNSQGFIRPAAEDEHVFHSLRPTEFGRSVVRLEHDANRLVYQTVAVFNDAERRRAA